MVYLLKILVLCIGYSQAIAYLAYKKAVDFCTGIEEHTS